MSASNDTGLVTYALEGKVALVGLNRPEKRNAISNRLINDIAEAVEQARSEARAAVLFGHGKHFCAGLDLAEHAEKTPFEGMMGSRRWHEVFARIEYSPIPWFCAIHGATVGGGLELASSAHIRIADATSYFALPEGQRGIFVGGGGSVRTARLMGTARMMDMMLTGRSIDAEQAERWNLAQYVVPEGKSIEKAVELASASANNSDISNYAVINALPRIADMPRDDGLFVESYVASFTSSSPEALERMNAFVQKKAGKITAPGER